MRICNVCGSEMALLCRGKGKGKSEVRVYVCTGCDVQETVLYWDGKEDLGEDKPPIHEIKEV